MKKQSGFAALELVLIVVVVAVLGFTAYNFLGHQSTDDTGSTASSVSVPRAPQVNSTSDLTAASNTLDQVDIGQNSADSAQLDAELSNF